jgi:hypothetical protein
MSDLSDILKRNQLDPEFSGDPFAMSPSPLAGYRGYDYKPAQTPYEAFVRPLGSAPKNLPSLEEQAKALREGHWRPPSQLEMAAAMLGPRVGKLPTKLPSAPAETQTHFIAYHGSPRGDIDEFVTPAFFSRHESTARSYRNDGGGMDNLNGLGAHALHDGWYPAHYAGAAENREQAIERLAADVKLYSTPGPGDYEKRGLLDILLGRSAKVDPEQQAFLDRQRAWSQSGLDYLQSGAPTGKIYEARLPNPTANYDGHQKADIEDAIAKGHKVITWGRSGVGGHEEIIVLDPKSIEVLRKFGLAPPAAGATLSGILQDEQQQ